MFTGGECAIYHHMLALTVHDLFISGECAHPAPHTGLAAVCLSFFVVMRFALQTGRHDLAAHGSPVDQ